MDGQPYRIQLDLRRRRAFCMRLAAANLVLAGTTALFIALWARLGEMEPPARWFVTHILVQGHLATENVLAVWYSSMLLLGLGILGLIAFRIDDAAGRSSLRYGWLLFAAVFAVLSLDELGSLHERIGMMPRLSPSSMGQSGWSYTLALPIAAVAAFLLAFAFIHLRGAPASVRLMTAGVTCFALNPLLESVEMALLKRGDGTWERLAHDVLLVLEEGGLELFGMLFFFAGVLSYLDRASGPSLEVQISRRVMHSGWWVMVAGLAGGAIVAPLVIAQLPRGDTGLTQNWFPAAAWFVTGGVALAAVRLRWVCAVSLAISASFGAGLYGYVDRLAVSAPWQLPLIGVLAAGGTLELVLGYYRFSFSPRSSIASPTLRRPRPNPS